MISTVIFTNFVLNNEAVLDDLNVSPHWNASTNKPDHDACHLDLNRQNVIEFTGSPSQTCGIQLDISNDTADLIHIPGNLCVYAERRGKSLDCQRRYVSFQSDETCIVVLQHPQVQLFLEVTDGYDKKILL